MTSQDTLEIHTRAAEGAKRKGHPNPCPYCGTPLRDREEPPLALPLIDVADKLRARDYELRGQTIDRLLPWHVLTRVDKQRWIELAIVALRALEAR